MAKRAKRSAISLISYDAEYLPESIKTYYEYVDEIVLGLDEKRISWSKNPFTFDETALWKELKKIDGDNKISIIEENFHGSDVAIQNDNHERNFLKSQCSHDWIFSFDADEELVNAKDFFLNFVPLIEPYRHKVDLVFTWFLPYKEFNNVVIGQDDEGNDKEADIMLVIGEGDGSFFRGEKQGFATGKNNTFNYARWTNNKRHILTPLAICHWSLCRPQEKLHQKIHNIGHSDIANTDPFFHIWQQVNLDNYTELSNFKSSGIGEVQWPRLVKIAKEAFPHLLKQQANLIY